MHRKSHRQRKAPLAEINVVPYIDVMLVLLVIFMITAPLLSQGIHVNLPQASARVLPPKKELPIVVSINATGRYFLNVAEKPQAPITERELFYRVAALLKLAEQAHAERPVYVKADRAVNYGNVVVVMALLQKAGASDVGLITDPHEWR